jgi:hypothetical protein
MLLTNILDFKLLPCSEKLQTLLQYEILWLHLTDLTKFSAYYCKMFTKYATKQYIYSFKVCDNQRI